MRSPLAIHVLRRGLLALLTVAGVTVLVFLALRVVPGAPGRAPRSAAEAPISWPHSAPEHDGVDQPRHVQYGRWLVSLVTARDPDTGRRQPALTLGASRFTHSTVASELIRRLPVTLTISITALLLMYGIAIPAGMFLGAAQGRRIESVISAGVLTAWSVPLVLVGTLAVGLLTRGGLGLEWFPSHGTQSPDAATLAAGARAADFAWHLALPVLCLTYGGAAYLTRHMRTAVLEQLHQPYVAAALAKGLSPRRVLTHHVLRNCLLPMIALGSALVPALLGGSVILESLFGIEGVGMYAFRALSNRDYDVVQSLALVAAVINVMSMLIADVLTMIVDRRIQPGGRT